jgi:hypothetical protein
VGLKTTSRRRRADDDSVSALERAETLADV